MRIIGAEYAPHEVHSRADVRRPPSNRRTLIPSDASTDRCRLPSELSFPRRPLMQVCLRPQVLRWIVIADPDDQILGMVRWGLECGLLCVTKRGTFVRVNGSLREELNDHDTLICVLKTIAKHASKSEALRVLNIIIAYKQLRGQTSRWIRDQKQIRLTKNLSVNKG